MNRELLECYACNGNMAARAALNQEPVSRVYIWAFTNLMNRLYGHI